MDLRPENQMELLRQPQKESVLRCPKCNSVFIENNICESCSYHLDFDVLGDPLGSKSYFQMVEDYLYNKPITFKLFPFLESFIETSEKREFTRKLLFRLDMILEHIHEYAHERNRYKLYSFECEEIIKELKSLKCDEGLLDKKLELTLGATHPLYQKLITVVLSEKVRNRSLVFMIAKAAASVVLIGTLFFILFLSLRV